MIDAIDASLVYIDQGRPVFACRDLNLTVRSNEFLCILGPSGSGKSSLLYLFSGLKAPTQGDVCIEGRSIRAMSDAERSRMRLHEFGFVFQQPFLLGYLSALENVVLASPDEDVEDEARCLLKTLGLEDKMHRRPHEMSGGERQRVCVARSLMGKPKAIFADEPTASLDHENGRRVVALLNEHRGEGSLVMVTHDASMTEGADRILHIDDGAVSESSAEQP